MEIDIIMGKLKLFKEKGKGFQMLTYGVYNNMLRLYIREGSGVANEKTKYIDSIAIPFIQARLFMEKLKELHKQKEGYNFMLELYGSKWVDNKIVKNEKSLTGKIGMARVKNKESDVINVIYVITNKNVRYVFPLQPTPYVIISENNKEVEDKEILSNYWSMAYSKTFEQLLENIPEARVIDKPENSKNEKKKDEYNIDGVI